MRRAIVISLLLSGCASQGVKVEFQRVEVPVRLPCITAAQYESLAKSIQQVEWTGNAEKDAAIATAQAVKYKQAWRETMALIEGCK
jgi:hypothetical protein